MLKPVIQPVLNTLVPAFGPATVAAAIFGGGPAQAATGDFDLDSFFGKKDSKVLVLLVVVVVVVLLLSRLVLYLLLHKVVGILSLSGGTPTALAQGSTIANNSYTWSRR